MDYLNKRETTKLIAFYKDEVLREALKKVLLEGVYRHGVLKEGEPANPLKNYTLAVVSKKGQYSNEQVGADLRATWEGINMVESAFETISKFKEEKEASVPSPFVNPGA